MYLVYGSSWYTMLVGVILFAHLGMAFLEAPAGRLGLRPTQFDPTGETMTDEKKRQREKSKEFVSSTLKHDTVFIHIFNASERLLTQVMHLSIHSVGSPKRDRRRGHSWHPGLRRTL